MLIKGTQPSRGPRTWLSQLINRKVSHFLSKLHRALSVTDILNEGLEWFEYYSFLEVFPGEYQAYSYRTLSSVARVCKAFHLPAIRVLWQRQLDVHVLLEFLPSLRGGATAGNS